MPKQGKLLLEWDTGKILDSWVDSKKADYPEQKKTDDQWREEINDDPDLWQMEWDDLYDSLTEHMARNKHGGWFAEVCNFGWRSQSGHKTFKATTGKELLQAILPDCECTFKIYRYGNGFAINNAHHDSPTWAEWYYISPCKEEQWEKRVEEYRKVA
jgi:hypothetical protein